MKKRLAIKQKGFTIVELMFTMTIAGVLLAIGIPTFGDLVKNNRISTETNKVIASLRYARGEAISRDVSIGMVPIVAGNDWTEGWQIRLDVDGNGDFTDAGDTVLRNIDRINQSTLLTGAGVTQIVFNSGGDVTAASVTTFTLEANDCTDDDNHIKTISVSLSGITTLIANAGC